MKNVLLLTLLTAFGNIYSQDINVAPSILWNGESSLAVNPNNNQNLVVAWMKLSFNLKIDLAVSYSTNGGNTWANVQTMPHFSPNFTSADPTIIFRDDGVCFLAYIDYKFNHDSGAVYVCKSTDGGATWSVPVKAIDAFASADKPVDRPWLAADNSNGPFANRLYLVTKSIKDAPLPHHIWLIHSNDDGQTWSQQKLVDDSIPTGLISNSMGVLAVTANGALHIAYIAYDLNINTLPVYALASSTDGGSTLNYNTAQVLQSNSALSPADTLVQFSYHLSANPADSNNLILTFTDKRYGDVDILSCNSVDGGVTWSQAQRINNDAISNGVYQDMSWGGFSNAGTYAVLWRDRRNTGTGQSVPYAVYGVSSFDGGLTFNTNFQLSSDTGSLSVPVDGNDFLGCALYDTTVYGSWTDKRNGANQLYFNYKNGNVLLSDNDLYETEKPITFQNPVSEVLNIATTFTDFMFVIYDINGKQILTSNEKCINVSALESGIYLLHLYNKQHSLHQKFIKY